MGHISFPHLSMYFAIALLTVVQRQISISIGLVLYSDPADFGEGSVTNLARFFVGTTRWMILLLLKLVVQPFATLSTRFLYTCHSYGSDEKQRIIAIFKKKSYERQPMNQKQTSRLQKYECIPTTRRKFTKPSPT